MPASSFSSVRTLAETHTTLYKKEIASQQEHSLHRQRGEGYLGTKHCAPVHREKSVSGADRFML
eukprot:1146057-Pelagomonas_calceolata.AAC.5